MTIEDGYAIQRAWLQLRLAEGRVVKGRKIGLTSRAMQQASQITEPDYAPLLDDMFFEAGGDIPLDRFIAPRVEVELAFILGRPLKGPGVTLADVLAATELVTPAVEIIDARIEQFDRETKAPRKVFDTIADFAANAGIVTGGRPVRPHDVDLRWAGAMLYKNGVIEETGLAAAVLNHPGNGIAWLANKIAPYDEQLERRRRRPRRLVHPADDRRRAATSSMSTTGRSGRSPSASPEPSRFATPENPMKQQKNAFKAALARREPQIGLWLSLADGYVAEMVATTGFDWLLIDAEHAPNDLRTVLAQLQAVAPYPVSPVVRPVQGDRALIKQYLDIGVQSLLVPMVHDAKQAAEVVAATRYAPAGTRGLGGAMSRVTRWSKIDELRRPGARRDLRPGAGGVEGGDGEPGGDRRGRRHRRRVLRPGRPLGLDGLPRPAGPSRGAEGDRRRHRHGAGRRQGAGDHRHRSGGLRALSARRSAVRRRRRRGRPADSRRHRSRSTIQALIRDAVRADGARCAISFSLGRAPLEAPHW